MLKEIKKEMLSQDKRCTSWPIFVVVEDLEIFGADPQFAHGMKRREGDGFDDFDLDDLCGDCRELHQQDEPMPEYCENCSSDLFEHYFIKENVPNLRAGFFFTAKACDEHIEENHHHYNDTAKSYGYSAYHNQELRHVMIAIVGEENAGVLM